jgi:hypothetical protein
MPLDKELLVEQYRQCNEHLRESDRKRDIALGFYATLSLALYGFAGGISAANTLLLSGIIGLTVLGIFLGFLFTLYRGWHGVYVIQAIALQEMIHKDRSNIDAEFVRKIDLRFNYVISVELFTFLILHIVIFLNSIAAWIVATDKNGHLVATGLVAAVVIEFLSHFVAMGVLDHWKNSGKLGTQYLWVLQSTTSSWP